MTWVGMEKRRLPTISRESDIGSKLRESASEFEKIRET
jgi:hypothetical protein